MGNAEVLAEAVLVVMKNGEGKKSFRGMKLSGANFDNLDLRGADFRNASVPFSSFKGTNLKYANFEGANCCGADFADANLHRANFKDANLSNADWRNVKDLYGVTLTMECRSFKGLRMSPGWWWGWIMYALLMEAPTQEDKEKVVLAMGADRYRVLREQYMREM